jgi:hypothetical protein
VSARISALLALTAAVAVAACNNDKTTGPRQTARVQFINASTQNLDVLRNGTAVSNGTNLGFGVSSSCFTVSPSTPGLTLRQSGTSTTIPGFVPNFTAGQRYTVLVTGAPGNLRFTTLPTTFPTLTGSQGALRIFNATSGTTGFDVYATAPGVTALPTAATMSNILAGNASAFIPLTSGQTLLRFTNAGSRDVVFTADAFNLGAGTNTFGVIAPASTGTGFRFFNLPQTSTCS